jgi:pyrroline-5-carboxylate reductase
VELRGTKIGLLGLGKMGTAIASGLKDKHKDLVLRGFDPLQKSALTAEESSGADLEQACDVILLCVKPQEAQSALQGFKGNKYYISIMAGVGTDRLQQILGGQAKVARAMPNLNAAVRQSATGLFCADESLRAIAVEIFSAIGRVEIVEKESLMHAVTGLSGSGPAFVFEFLDALAQGGVDRGLPYDRALALAVQTVLGSAQYVQTEGKHPLELRSKVTSPGGTTIAGLGALEKNGFRYAVMNAVAAASDRSKELGG